MTDRYTVFGSDELGGYVVFDKRTGTTVNPIEIDRPQLPLAQMRFYETKPEAESAAERLNNAYARAMA